MLCHSLVIFFQLTDPLPTCSGSVVLLVYSRRHIRTGQSVVKLCFLYSLWDEEQEPVRSDGELEQCCLFNSRVYLGVAQPASPPLHLPLLPLLPFSVSYLDFLFSLLSPLLPCVLVFSFSPAFMFPLVLISPHLFSLSFFVSPLFSLLYSFFLLPLLVPWSSVFSIFSLFSLSLLILSPSLSLTLGKCLSFTHTHIERTATSYSMTLYVIFDFVFLWNWAALQNNKCTWNHHFSIRWILHVISNSINCGILAAFCV